MTKFTKTIFTALSYPDFNTSKVTDVNLTASIYFADNNFEIRIENNESYVYLDTLNKLKIPAIPKLGELDIEKIIHSKYMIS
jgi:hypothetical protein